MYEQQRRHISQLCFRLGLLGRCGTQGTCGRNGNERAKPSHLGVQRHLMDHICVTSPEITFIQLGTILTDVQIALVGMMLCGSYAIAPTEGRQLINRNPLTTLE